MRSLRTAMKSSPAQQQRPNAAKKKKKQGKNFIPLYHYEEMLFLEGKEIYWPKFPSTDEWINKQGYTTLFGNKKKWTADTCYNMDKPWKGYAKWKKPITKDHILYDSIYMKCPE